MPTDLERLQVGDQIGGAARDAVGLLVPIGGRSWLLHRDRRQLLLLPDLRRGPSSSRDVFAGAGRVLLLERAVDPDDEGLSYVEHRRSEAVCRLTLSTLAVDELDYRPNPDHLHFPYLAGAPEGAGVAVLQPSHAGPVGQMRHTADGRVALWLGKFDGLPARHLLTVEAMVWHGPDDSPVQWSPDGRWIALSLAETLDRRVAAALSVHLVNAESGQVVTRLPGYELCGSASWSPSGNRLLLRADTTGVCTYDLHTDEVEPVALMSGRQQQPWVAGAWRPLRLADEHRLLIARRQGTIATVCTGALAGGPLEPVFSWRDRMDLAPILRQMPADCWQ